jgi:hypothetical protein
MSLSHLTQADPLVNPMEMEARMRELVVASRRNIKKENVAATFINYSDVHSCPASNTPELLDLPPQPSCPRKLSSQEVMDSLTIQQNRLAAEIALARARLARAASMDRSAPHYIFTLSADIPNRAGNRMRRKDLWPQSNPEGLIIDISDDEDDDAAEEVERRGRVLGPITNHS